MLAAADRASGQHHERACAIPRPALGGGREAPRPSRSGSEARTAPWCRRSNAPSTPSASSAGGRAASTAAALAARRGRDSIHDGDRPGGAVAGRPRPAGAGRPPVRAARASGAPGPCAGLRRAAVPAASDGLRAAVASARDRTQGAQAIPWPRASGRRGGPRQDHRSLHGAQGIRAARDGGAHPGADTGLSCRPVAGGAGEQVRPDVRDHLRALPARGPRGLLEPEPHRCLDRHGPAPRARRAPARADLRHRHRR